MFEDLKSYLKEKKVIRRKKSLYDFSEDKEKNGKKLKKIDIWDRIKFIRFNSKNNDKNSTVNTQKIKEAGLLVTAAVLIGIGYTNFSTNSSISNDLNSNTLATSSTNNIGDVQLVSSSATIVENDNSENSKNEVFNDNSYTNNNNNNTVQETASNNALVSNDDMGESESNNVVETVSSSSNQDYFSELKLERNEMYSKNLENYQKILENSTISSEQKAIAIQEIEKINNLQNSIEIAEKLIKLKDFEDVVIYSANDKVSVIVRVAALSETQVAQIQNIVSKELGANISDITISNK